MAYTITGSEVLQVLPIQANSQPAATTVQVTTQQIASLAATEQTQFVNTPIGTVGNGTLTAAGIVGGLITRTGPTSAFTDTTDTAANIVAAVPSLVIGQSFPMIVKNATGFVDTIAAGTGVTLPLQVAIPPFGFAQYEVTINSATAVTLTHIQTDNITNLYVGNLSLSSATNTTTMSVITGFAVPLPNSGTYSILAALPVNTTAGGGVSLAIGTNPSGTLTASSLNVFGKFYTATGIAVSQSSTFGSNPGNGVGTTAAIILAELEGSITTTAAGTLQVYGGQQAANAGSTNFLTNGFLQVERIG